jgi:hypothetical protein
MKQNPKATISCKSPVAAVRDLEAPRLIVNIGLKSIA